MSLSNNAKEFFKKTGNIDIMVGIPSYNNEKTIGFVIEQVVEGIKNFSPSLKGFIFNSDGGSGDSTVGEVERKKNELDFPVYSFPYKGTPGKGSSLFAILEAAVITNAKAVIFLDSDLRSVRPWWTELFLDSILNKGYDYLTPYYVRHKYDGTITNNIVYPIIYGLLGFDIRQPIGGDFGLSGNIVSHYGEKIKNSPIENAYRFGIDIYLTTEAIAGGFNIGQVFLGAKIHDVKDPGKTLAPMFSQVTSTLFTQIWKYEDMWKNFTRKKEIPLLGKPVQVESEDIVVNTDILFEKFEKGMKEYEVDYNHILGEENYNKLKNLTNKEQCYISPIVWTHIVYDYIRAFKKDGEDIIPSLLPLYFGKILSFVNETSNMNTKDAEKLILKQGEIFWNERDYLLREK